MKFIRWDDPEEWSIFHLFDNDVLIKQLKNLKPKEQFKLIERMFERPMLSLVISKTNNFPRLPVSIEMVSTFNYCVNPETSFSVEKRNLNGFQRIETISITHKTKKPQQIGNGLLAQAALMLVDQDTVFSGQEMITALIDKGGSELESTTVLMQLLSFNIIYCPQ